MPKPPPDVATDGTAAAQPADGAAIAPPPSHRRVRIAAIATLVLGVVLLGAVALLAGGGGGPATGAARIVPGDALIYVHLSTDPTRPAVARAGALLRRLPDRGSGPAALVDRFLAVVGGAPSTSFATVRPWLGREAALALIPRAGTSADAEIVLDVRSRVRARAFLTGRGAVADGRYRQVGLLRYPTGAEVAFVGHYLVVGTDAAVRASIDTGNGGRALADGDAYGQAMSDAPDDRALDAYVSGDGAARLLAVRGGLLGDLGVLLGAPTLRGAAISMSAAPPGVVVHVHRVLTAASPGGASFTPSLARVLPAGSPLLIEGHGLRGLAPRLLASTGKLGLLPALPDLLRRVGAALSADGVDVGKVLELFDGDSAVALASGTGTPALVIVTRTSNMPAARVTLAGLESSLQQLFSAPASGPGLAPGASDVLLDGVTVHEMRLAPGLSLDIAVFRGLIVVATSLRGVADIAARTRALGATPGYLSVLAHRPDDVTSLGFFNLSQLLGYADQSQIPRDGGYRSLRPDLTRVREVGMSSAAEGTDTTAELYLHIP